MVINKYRKEKRRRFVNSNRGREKEGEEGSDRDKRKKKIRKERVKT